jgi:predicted RNA-binding Zn-ribbon protein involved in translation (DUF1610 family)
VECLVTFLILFAAFLFITGSAAHAHSRRTRRRYLYETLARRYAGSFVPGGFWRRPTLRLRYGETTAAVQELSNAPPYAGCCTQIAINWPDRNMRCEIVPRALSELSGTQYYLCEFAMEDREFDAMFIVRGTDEQSIRQTIKDGVRWQMRQIAQLFGTGSAYVLIQSGQIIVRKPDPISRYDELQAVVERALELYDQIMLTRASGIQFLESDEAQTLNNVVCPVCGENVIQQLVFCRRCKTPYHADCWEFVGACSVYGCGEKRYLQPQTAHATANPHSKPATDQLRAEPPPR